MALRAIEPTTTVSTASAVEVAGRPAYELVLTPKDSQTLISAVKIAVDGETSAPLRVQVLGADAKTVAEVAYESVDFTAPEARYFTFNPPAGAKVTEKGTVEAPAAKKPSKADREAAQAKLDEARDHTQVVGIGVEQRRGGGRAGIGEQRPADHVPQLAPDGPGTAGLAGAGRDRVLRGADRRRPRRRGRGAAAAALRRPGEVTPGVPAHDGGRG